MHSDLNESPRNPPRTASAEVARRLRDLPAELRPPYDFDEFRRRVRQRRLRRQTALTRWPLAAAAAGLVAIVAGIAFWGRVTEPQLLADSMQPVTDPQPEAAPMRESAERAERWLLQFPHEPVVVRVGTQFVVTELEDQIAWVDDTLTDEQFHAVDPSRIAALRDERARLVNSLAKVRYAQTLAAQAR